MRENDAILKGFDGFCPICQGSLRSYEEIKGRKYTVHIACLNGCVHVQRAVIIANDKDQANKNKAAALARSAWLEIVSGGRKNWKKRG